MPAEAPISWADRERAEDIIVGRRSRVAGSVCHREQVPARHAIGTQIESAPPSVAGAAPCSRRATNSLVAADDTGRYAEIGSEDVGKAAPQTISPGATEESLADDGLVAGEGAGCDRGRDAPVIGEATTEAIAREETACVGGAAFSQVIGERAVADGHGRREANTFIVDTAAEACTDQDEATAAGVVAASEGLVAEECAVGDRRRAFTIQATSDTRADPA